MAKFKFKLKKNWKKVLTVGLGILMFIGAIFGISAIAKKAEEDRTTISPFYSVGGLNLLGKYEEREDSIYTKDAFECQGLKITPDFDSQVSYQVFFYDKNEQFLSSSSIINTFYDEACPLAYYARIMIMPQNDDKVSWYEVGSYANQLTVEVKKDQTYKPEDRLVTFKVDDFAKKNFTETWSFNDATTTLDTRYVLNKYIPVTGIDVVIHCESEDFTYKVGVFKGSCSTENLILGTGFVEQTEYPLYNYITDADNIYYLAIGFEKKDQTAFTASDVQTLAKKFYITYNA